MLEKILALLIKINYSYIVYFYYWLAGLPTFFTYANFCAD